MTNKRYTDEEIKSSLEVIATSQNCNECKIRNGRWGTCNCSQITANVALDLINRQRAEIERLKKENRGFLRNYSTVDVQEIKYGEWTKDDSGGCYCSACGWYADYDYDYVTYVTNNGLGNGDFNYCPNCGAKMDGGNNNA